MGMDIHYLLDQLPCELSFNPVSEGLVNIRLISYKIKLGLQDVEWLVSIPHQSLTNKTKLYERESPG
jgi:hypothetical protein